MPHYKDTDNKLHWLDDPSFQYLLPIGSIQITKEEAEAIRIANLPPPEAPISITPRQIRMALTQMGLRNQVESLVDASDQDIKDWYEYSSRFNRDHPKVLEIAALLNINDEQLASLWQLGSTL